MVKRHLKIRGSGPGIPMAHSGKSKCENMDPKLWKLLPVVNGEIGMDSKDLLLLYY